MALSPSFAGVILSAGASSRMGRDKALLPWRDGTFLSAAIRALQPATELVIVVAGANAASLAPIADSQAAFLAVNPNPQQGQFSSLLVGLQEVLNRGRDAAIVTLVDRPPAEVETIEQLKAAFLASDEQVWAVVPEFGGKHGHPFVIGREMIEAFLRAPAHSSARDVEHANQAHIRYFPVNDPLVAANVDTPEDFEKLSRRYRGLRTETKYSAFQRFADSVLALRPRVAVFDCDGTLWSGDAGADFFYWEVERGLIAPDVAQWAIARYKDYKAGNVGEDTMCGEMVTINAGSSLQSLQEAAEEFFSSVVETRIFPEMLRLTHELESIGCEVWAVSSTNDWVVHEGVKRFGIPRPRVLAACVHIEEGQATDRIIRVPSGPGKAAAIAEVVRKPVDVCFGNSIHDVAMLEIARHAFAVNPNPDLEKIAQEKSWHIYWPEGTK
ncbi:MAG: NTP transferase domain-containing protein [Candidatus Angelobacter sp.]